MIAGCHSQQNKEASGDHIPIIIHNGKKVQLSGEKAVEITKKLILIAKDCDDYYELIVTNDLITKLKKEEFYLEVIYPEPQSFSFGKFGIKEPSRVFIPLSGKFSSSGQITYFYGTSDYSNTPFSNSNGLEKIMEALSQLSR